MNIMLLIVGVASFAIGQVATGSWSRSLVTFNVVMGSNQELKARASVEALAQLQVPHARVRRSGRVEEIDVDRARARRRRAARGGRRRARGRADRLLGDARGAGGRAHRRERAGAQGRARRFPRATIALGDRTNLVFQNTQVTRGTATFVVTATGQATQMGQIADMVTATKRTRSPLQRELDGMTKVFGLVAWLAVAVIAIVGIARGQDIETLLLLCVSTAIASIPTGLPTFVQAMLSSGRAAPGRVEGGRQVAHRRRDAGRDDGHQQRQDRHADDERDDGHDDARRRRVVHDRRRRLREDRRDPGRRRRATRRTSTASPSGLTLCTDATVGDDGSVIGDPTEAAFVVLAAKMGVDAEQTRDALPRRAEVPFDSEYKFMATFHDRPDVDDRRDPATAALRRRSRALPTWSSSAAATPCGTASRCRSSTVRDEILAANQQLSERGLRVLAFAARDLDDAAMSAALADPMAAVNDLVLVALVGIMDPLRTEAKDAVRIALKAGIDVRMITGDHTVTARAIADELGLGPGVITGTELPSDRCRGDRPAPRLHVFGRVAPEDKLRLARLMQESGEVVAMTGDAVNDAAALKQADVVSVAGHRDHFTRLLHQSRKPELVLRRSPAEDVEAGGAGR